MAAAVTVSSRDIFVEANGLRHHLIARGAPGTPVVMMIHGIAGQARIFDAIASNLSARYHVYALDLRGRGESNWGTPDSYHVDNYVADLEAVRAALGLERFALIGTSLGGEVATQYAASYPQHVQRLVINDFGPEVDARGRDRIYQYLGNAPEAFADLKSAIKYFRDSYAGQVEHLPEDQIAEFARHNVRRDDSGLYVWKMDPAVRKGSTRPPSRDSWEAFRAVQAPVLIVRGSQTDMLARATAERMLAEKPGAKLVEVPGVGNAPMLTEPEVLGTLETFLAGSEDQ